MIQGETIHIEERIGETRSTLADIDRARKELGWAPLVSLVDYINENIDKTI